MKIIASFAFCGLLLLLLIGRAAAQDGTAWRGPVAEVGDWFEPANWTNSFPVPGPYAYSTFIDNGGKARINGGNAFSWQLQVGNTLAGELIVDRGSLDLRSAFLGGAKNSVGLMTLNGGSVASQNLLLGQSGYGRIDQVGGTVQSDHLTLGDRSFYPPLAPRTLLTPDDFGRGDYNLSGGRVNLYQADVGTSGVGYFRQSGGVAKIAYRLSVGGLTSQYDNSYNQLFPDFQYPRITQLTTSVTSMGPLGFMPTPAPSRGRFELTGGSLETEQLLINSTGAGRQTGGTLQADYIDAHGRYDFAGGTLEVASGLRAMNIDFAGSSATLNAGAAIVNFAGAPQHAENAKITVGANSLTIFPRDFDLASIGEFSTQGLVHFAGDDLAIPLNRTVEGWGQIADHTIVAGKLLASSQEEAAINLLGLELKTGAEVNLGRGVLTVEDDRTAIRGGSLATHTINVAGKILLHPALPPTTPGGPILEFHTPGAIPGLVRQTGGTVDAYVVAVNNGRYEISGGTLTAERIEVKTNQPPYTSITPEELTTNFTQRGGAVSVESLELNAVYLYMMNFGHATTDTLGAAPPILTEVDGRLPRLTTTSDAHPMYEMHGGRLQAGRIDLDQLYSNQRVSFIQTGGEVVATETVALNGRNSSYTISGGSLHTRRLHVGSASPYAEPAGTLAILNDDARITVAGELLFGRGSQFVAAAGTTIHITRPQPLDRFEYPALTTNEVAIHSTNAEELAGLSNLTLIFEGGSDLVATLETAGADRGPTLAGFYKNFALDTLVIGGLEPAQLSLVDMFQNQEGGALPNALYVDHLVINEGSMLDLNGLKLYYRTASIAASSLTADANFGIQVVPEPAAAVLALVAAPLFIRRRFSS
ncbi:hypothetical protein [Lacipirellula sp.]|uniref:hypothetical protein n=1 Tax=Lacipirellula sp. TaxID=2691419 RepID=UPI003D145A1D